MYIYQLFSFSKINLSLSALWHHIHIKVPTSLYISFTLHKIHIKQSMSLSFALFKSEKGGTGGGREMCCAVIMGPALQLNWPGRDLEPAGLA